MKNNSRAEFLTSVIELAASAPLYRGAAFGVIYDRFSYVYQDGTYVLDVKEFLGPNDARFVIPRLFLGYIFISDDVVERMKVEKWDFKGVGEYESGNNMFITDLISNGLEKGKALEIINSLIFEKKPKRVVYYKMVDGEFKLFEIDIPITATKEQLASYSIDI